MIKKSMFLTCVHVLLSIVVWESKEKPEKTKQFMWYTYGKYIFGKNNYAMCVNQSIIRTAHTHTNTPFFILRVYIVL